MQHEHSTRHHTDTEHHQEEPIEQKPVNKPIDSIYFLPAAILLGAVLISGSIFYSTKQFITKRSADITQLSGNQQQAPSAKAAQAQTPPPDSGSVTVATDDDPVLGDKNAPLTLIEFSDYECPFCKRYFTDTFPELKKNYIDTGKLKMVFRDYPLPFHDPLATTEAMAASCAREQGGDTVYFKYHGEIFKRTKSNGQGMVKDELYKIAADLNLNANNFKSCLDSEKYKDEVSKDIAAGSAAGVSGTPTLFIGKSNASGNIEGTRIVGAQPYAVFKAAIDQLLK